MSFAYFPLSQEQKNQRSRIWESLFQHAHAGRVAISYQGKYPDQEQIEKQMMPDEEIPLGNRGEAGWDQEIRRQIHRLRLNASSVLQDDYFPALSIPRPVHGQSQGLAELLGCELRKHEKEPDFYYPVPWITMPDDLDQIKIKPLEQCMYGQAVRFAEYAVRATEGQLAVRNPVMTGPIDTVNYIIGTMRLMEWIYDEPAALHKLLDIVTDQIIHVIQELKRVSNGQIAPDHSACMPRGYALCSEIRAIISENSFSEYELPYLKRISRECGPYMIHSCGSWEHVLKASMTDPNLRMVNLMSREVDVRKVFDLTQGNVSLAIGRTFNMNETWTWPDTQSFYRNIMQSISRPVPVELTVAAEDLQDYLLVQEEEHAGKSGMFTWNPASSR
jgi:hypothetical protein